jgi:hypothetical protein
MRSMMALALAVGVVLALTSTASAQGRGRGGFGGPSLLGIAQVQDELKLTDKQKEEVQAFLEKHGERARGAFQEIQGDFSKFGQVMQKVNAEGMKEAAKFLKPEQLARLKGLNWQQAGVTALGNDDELQKELKVTADQKEKLKKLADDLQRDRMELFQGGGFGDPETQKKSQALAKDYATKAEQTLNDGQRKTYKDLLGKPFEFPTFGRGRRGGGGA